MKINIIDNFFIDLEDKNATLMCGKKTIGYYSTVESAVNKVIQLKVLNENDELTLKEYIEKLREVKYKIEV